MKVFQGITDHGCEETDECLLLFSHKEIQNIIEVLAQIAGGEWEVKSRPPLTPKQMKSKAKKAMSILQHVIY